MPWPPPRDTSSGSDCFSRKTWSDTSGLPRRATLAGSDSRRLSLRKPRRRTARSPQWAHSASCPKMSSMSAGATVDHLRDEGLVETVDLGDDERGLVLTKEARDLLDFHTMERDGEAPQASPPPRVGAAACESERADRSIVPSLR